MAQVELTFDTPIRQSADERVLSSIPPEIYNKIFTYHHFKIDEDLNSLLYCRLNWAVLSLVCKFFRACFIPLLFSHVEFENDNLHHDFTSRSAIAFCESIVSGDENSHYFARSVRSCKLVTRILVHRRGDVEQPTLPYPSIYIGAMHYMSNISSLLLQSSYIDSDLLDCICSLFNLTSLTLTHKLMIADDLTSDQLMRLAALKLTKFHLSRFVRGTPGPTTFYEVLEKCLLTWPLRSLYIDPQFPSATPLPVLQHNSTTSQLRELHLALVDLASKDFTALLEATPNLTELSICQVDGAVRQYPRRVLPNLRSVSGPAHWALGLVPGRPVESVVQTQEYATELPELNILLNAFGGLYSLLRKSTSTLKHLSVCQAIYDRLPPLSHFPEGWLEELRIVGWVMGYGVSDEVLVYDREQTQARVKQCMSELASRLASPSCILHLHLDMFHDSCELDIYGQHMIITSCIVTEFPRLQSIIVSRWIKWHLDIHGVWHPHLYETDAMLRGSTLQSFLNRIKTYKIYIGNGHQREFNLISDYDGFLSHVVPPNHPAWKMVHETEMMALEENKERIELLEGEDEESSLSDSMNEPVEPHLTTPMTSNTPTVCLYRGGQRRIADFGL